MRLAVLFAVVGCAAAPEQTALDDARARWQAGALPAYSFTWGENCHCVGYTFREIQIFVVENAITSATYVEDSTAVPENVMLRLKTIDELFAVIQAAIDRPAYEVDCTYDAALGWPSQVRIDYEQYTADEELGVVIKDVHELMR
jgi:hypothetical protein